MSIILATLVFAVTLSLLPMCQSEAVEEETLRLLSCRPGEGCKKYQGEHKKKGGEEDKSKDKAIERA